MQIARRTRGALVLSLTPLVDVLLIMLIFFMVTSTYLNLDMIPLAERGEEMAEGGAGAGGEQTGTLLLRIDAGGQAHLRGQALDGTALEGALRDALARQPEVQLLILPSAFADVQALVSVLESAQRAGIGNTSVVRAEGGQ